MNISQNCNNSSNTTMNNNTMNGTKRPRPPPPPPVRTPNLLDSGRILHTGTMLGAFQNGMAKTVNAAAIVAEAVSSRKSGSKSQSASRTQQQAPMKFNQRQDSSDSFSLTSSPGYNAKNMEAPLLQHASRINKTNCLIRQDSNDNFGMTSRYHLPGKITMRQDSSVSSCDSFSQTSSPGYNTKMLEQPLLAHAVKLHASKYDEDESKSADFFA